MFISAHDEDDVKFSAVLHLESKQRCWLLFFEGVLHRGQSIATKSLLLFQELYTHVLRGLQP